MLLFSCFSHKHMLCSQVRKGRYSVVCTEVLSPQQRDILVVGILVVRGKALALNFAADI